MMLFYDYGKVYLEEQELLHWTDLGFGSLLEGLSQVGRRTGKLLASETMSHETLGSLPCLLVVWLTVPSS